MTSRLGIQLEPWHPLDELVQVARRVRDSIDLVWLPDQPLMRNVYVMLAHVAREAGIGVGTNITHPVSQNPIEIAKSFATLREIVPADREVLAGFGVGGVMVTSFYNRGHRLDMVAESIDLLPKLWAGETVELDYPHIGKAFGYRPGFKAKLTFDVAGQIPIVVAGYGPKILKLAGERSDGIISPSNTPPYSIRAFRSGKLAEVGGLAIVAEGTRAQSADFRRIFGINISVSNDRARAVAFARRQIVLIVGNKTFWPVLETLGYDMAAAAEVHGAFAAGEGIDGAVQRLSADFDDLIVSGSPDEVIGGMAELKKLAEDVGYNEFYIGVPLGPDLHEAADIVAEQLVPAVWPERA